MQGKDLEHHSERDGEDKPRANALHRASDERDGKRGGRCAHDRADKEGAQREQGELASGEPFHEQVRKRQHHADHEHIAHHKPLRDGYVDAKSKRQLRQGDIKCGLAVHTGEATAEEAHEREVGMSHLDTGTGKFDIA